MKKRKILMIAVAVTVVAIAGVCVYSLLLRGSTALAVNATQLSIGEKYLAELNYEKATATLENVIVVEPNNTEAYLALATAYRYMGDMDTARETLEGGYRATNSSLIERELGALAQTENTADNASGSAAVGATTVEIAGKSYPTDSTELILRDCDLTDKDLEKLSAFTRLERLDISGNNITDIHAIADIPTLKRFYAANNAIVDISPLASLRSLAYVGLRGNRITDADALFSLDSLIYLHLSDNLITTVPGVGENLQLLYLSGNNISDVAVIENAHLLFCDISGNAGM
jgi:tetratricopeptide (TPR) repeat protein